MFSYIFRILILLLIAQTSFSTQFLTISDIHYSGQDISGEGHDTNDNLLHLAMTKFTQLAKEADFIIQLGDLPTHGKYPAEEKENYEKIVFQSLYQADTAAKPMFYVTGNNDSLEGNYQPFSYSGLSPLSFAEDWRGACVHCENLLINDENMYSGGYYSSYVSPSNHDIMLIALNSIQFADLSDRPAPYPNQKEDASTQLSWLHQQLSQHRAKQLLIAMHIPPGNDYQGKPNWEKPYLTQFLELLKLSRSHFQQITLLTSHSHMDEIRKINLGNNETIYAFSTPSISRIHSNNSAMKLFSLDKDSILANFTTYYTPSDEHWLNDHYTAIHSEGIFPECQGRKLADCLNSLNQDSICSDIERGKYYGVKTDHVDNSACRLIYQVD